MSDICVEAFLIEPINEKFDFKKLFSECVERLKAVIGKLIAYIKQKLAKPKGTWDKKDGNFENGLAVFKKKNPDEKTDIQVLPNLKKELFGSFDNICSLIDEMADAFNEIYNKTHGTSDDKVEVVAKAAMDLLHKLTGNKYSEDALTDTSKGETFRHDIQSSFYSDKKVHDVKTVDISDAKNMPGYAFFYSLSSYDTYTKNLEKLDRSITKLHDATNKDWDDLFKNVLPHMSSKDDWAKMGVDTNDPKFKKYVPVENDPKKREQARAQFDMFMSGGGPQTEDTTKCKAIINNVLIPCLHKVAAVLIKYINTLYDNAHLVHRIIHYEYKDGPTITATWTKPVNHTYEKDFVPDKEDDETKEESYDFLKALDNI